MSKIYQTIYTEIDNIIKGVPNIKEIKKAPSTNFTKYPAAIFFPSQVSNIFSTNADNFREYKFKLFIVAGVEQTTMDNIFQNVLANTSDAVIQAFDTNWSLNTIEGRRAWIRIDAGNWGVEKTDKGLIGVAEYDLIVKLSVNN